MRLRLPFAAGTIASVILATVIAVGGFLPANASNSRLTSNVLPHGARYFQTHYRAGVQLVHHKNTLQPHQVRASSLPAQSSVNIADYPAVGQQGDIGSCAAWASAWDLSYVARERTGNLGLLYSSRYLYDRFITLYDDGQDGGSNVEGDLEAVHSEGVPLFDQLPYPPYQLDDPVPLVDAYGNSIVHDAAWNKLPISVVQLTNGYEGGQALINEMKASIDAGRPVMLAFPVFPSFDNAANQWLIVSPGPNDSSRGGHENVELAYNDTLKFPDGTVGGFYDTNQWGTSWGRSGRAWLSYDFVARYAFDAAYISWNGPKPTPTPSPSPTPQPTETPTPSPTVTPGPSPTPTPKPHPRHPHGWPKRPGRLVYR